ncbi:MAG: PAS domain S-box protein [bacterium]
MTDEAVQALEREALFRELIDSISQCVYVATADEKTLFASKAYEDIWGRSRESVMAMTRSWFDAIHPDDKASVTAGFDERKGDRFNLEYRVIRPDGTIRWVGDRGIRLRDRDGKVQRVMGIVEDITDRRTAANARRDAHVELRKHAIEQQVLLDTIPAMVWIKDSHNVIVRANRRAAEAVGRRLEEIENKSAYDLHPREAASYHKNDLEVIRSGKPKLGIVEEFTTTDGERRWIQTDKVPYFADDGTSIGVVVFAQDITERKAEESRLQAMARGLRAVIDIADELIACPDVDTTYRRMVELVRARLGIERAAVFVEDGDLFQGTYGTDLEGRTTDERTLRFPGDEGWRDALRPKDTRDLWRLLPDAPIYAWNGAGRSVVGRGWVACTPIAQPGRKPMALFCNDAAISGSAFDPLRQDLVAVLCSMMANVLQRRRAETVLRESEKKFRSLAETVNASIFLFQASALTYVNPAASRISGYSQEELMRMNFWDLIHPDYQELVRERGMARQRGEKVLSRYELKIRTKQGEDRWVDFSSNTVDSDGRPAVLGVAFDITKRKRAEEQLFRRVESERITMLVATDLGSLVGGTMEKRVRNALSRIAGLLGAQTSNLLLFSDDMTIVTEVHEWRARGVPSVKGLLHEMRIDHARYIAPRVLAGEIVKVERVADLPADADFERKVAEGAGVFSFVVVPVVGRGRVTGCLLFGCTRRTCRWNPENSGLLTLMGEILFDALYRNRLEEEHARLANKILEFQEEERKKLSDVLHDDVGQILTLTAMELGAVKTSDRKSAAIVRRAAKRAQSALDVVRGLAGSLRPPTLDEFGIAAGLKALCREYNRRAGLKVVCSVESDGNVFCDALRTCLYRVLQEALTNAARHARATRVKVSFTTNKTKAVLEIQDNGHGFNVGSLTRRRGIGLIGMKERLTGCGGLLDIRSSPGTGTRIRATVPLRASTRPRRVGTILHRKR